jgi:oligopeptide transport system substrate-binding protein
VAAALSGRRRRGGAGPRWRRGWAAAVVLLALGAALVGSSSPEIGRAAGRETASIVVGAPATLDPAAAGDAASAAVIGALFESLTTFDANLVLRPALAAGWTVEAGGRRVVFDLRPGLRFSDGSPLTAADVVRSWLRVIDPTVPSPLASLFDDVVGAEAYRTGSLRDPDQVGVRAEGPTRVVVDLLRPGADLPAIVASPTFAVVPPAVGHDPAALTPVAFVASGGYRLAAVSEAALSLEANAHYWAGAPAIRRLELVTDLGGRSPVAVFEAGEVDYTPIDPSDATWIAWDRELGPALRSVPALGLTYVGFDTRRPPFDDPRVRRAFAWAVDWRRLVELTSSGAATPATSMVPPGIPGRPEGDFGPRYDPEAARAALAEAGHPNGVGFPPVTFVSSGTGWEEAIVAEIRTVLGVPVSAEVMPFEDYFARLDHDPPAFWALSWIADYPGPNDFLGLLLGSGRTNNYGGWSSPEFDAAIEAALASADPAAARTGYEAAETIVARDVPVIPVAYGDGWALSRAGLLGAGQNGLGSLRFAGLAWGE